MKKLLLCLLLVGCAGQTGSPGYNGSNGVDGAPGATGPKGDTGDTGAQGPKGADGTVVITVQFCPGAVATYPSVFPEYGICLNNQIFAVYSANGGFLALIPPGVYSSNAIGSACNFTVAENCVIQ